METAEQKEETSVLVTMAGNGLKAKCMAATAKLREEYTPAGEESKYSEKAQAIHDLIKNNEFGCQIDNVRKLMEIAIEEPIKEIGRRKRYENCFEFILFSLVVALKDDVNTVREAFKEGDSILLCTKSGSYRVYLSGVDNDGDDYVDGIKLCDDLFRPATDAEIEAYFA